MSTTEPKPLTSVTVNAHEDDLQNVATILGAILQTITVVGPLVIQWIALSKGSSPNILVNKSA